MLAAATLGVPLGMVLFWLGRHNSAAVSTVAATMAGAAGRARLASLLLGVAGAAATMVLALPLGILAVRFNGPVVALLERTAWLAQGVPGIVVALALVTLSLGLCRAALSDGELLVLAYAILFLPLALVSVRAALLQAQAGLEERAARSGSARCAHLARHAAAGRARAWARRRRWCSCRC